MATQSIAHSLVSAFLAGEAGIDGARASLTSAVASQLASLQSVVKGAKPITDKVWVDTLHDDVLAGMVASGRYAVDEKGKSLSAASATSRLKVSVIALTSGIVPTDDDTSLNKFVQRVRPILVKRGAIPATKAGRPVSEAKEQDRAYLKAAFLVAGDKARAKVLAVIMADYAEEFDDWADEVMVAHDNAVTTKARGTDRR